MPTQITRQGRNEVGPRHCNRIYRSAWRRTDTYTSNSTGEVFIELRFCDGPNDESEMFIAPYAGDPGNGKYNSECPSCYLGHSHTLAYHNKHAVIPDPFRA